ncbi:hypothetical protein SAMN05892877_10514 [Rhizobium subbaraonis]|uniref:Uncharacterized protein n=1 Tax=Rhizobium subbaraonis TaxID=908946 RepID=A0A285U8G6_9HYPH|nr:hypothetical protein [Rhizobium subbaraonis]SOC38119.1 hypothetical protein SAMN05892877_10514 [Rhizobium subbaraonis]
MDDFAPIDLNDDDRRTYSKLCAAVHDFSMAVEYGEFILKKGWNAHAADRGNAYLLQSAFVTAMLVSYGRAFTQSNGWNDFPKELLDLYDAGELGQHERFRELRNRVYAHTDPREFKVHPWTKVLISVAPRHHVEADESR